MSNVQPLKAESIHLSYGTLQVLKGVSLMVNASEGVVLLGANGCGKSSLMRVLNGLERPQQGSVEIFGKPVTGARGSGLRAIRRQMGYVFQQFNLVPQLSAFQNVLLGLLGQRPFGLIGCMSPLASAEDREQAMACLERVGMSDRAMHRPAELSGGQQQRVAIARMLMQSPTIVIADEPVASLDPRAGRQVLELLWEIVRERELSMLCTLHQVELAREFADRIVGIKAGATALDAPAQNIELSAINALYETA